MAVNQKLFLHQASGQKYLRGTDESHHLCHGNTGDKCFHGADRGLSDCGFCRNRTRTSSGPSETLSTFLTNISKSAFNAGAIGYLAMRNATVAGAVGGCQAETGVAAAMAASAATELLGGNSKQCTHAASTVLMNMLDWSVTR